VRNPSWRNQERDTSRASESGFTLQELLVVLAVSSILFMLGMTLFGFVTRLVSGAARKGDSRDRVEHVLQRISTDIGRANMVSEVTDSTLLLLMHDARTVRYQFSHGLLMRNEDTLGSPPGACLNLTVREISGDSTFSPHRLSLRVWSERNEGLNGAECTASLPFSSAFSIRRGLFPGRFVR
jgi:prepilin-type N-terminal cleavage/methylation domain-containing protein